MRIFLVLCVLSILYISAVYAEGTNNNETQAEMFLDEYNVQAQIEIPKSVTAAWTYNTNITNYNSEKQVEANLAEAAFAKEMQVRAAEFDRTGFSYDTNRRLEKLLYIGDAALDDEQKLEELNNILASMETRYSTGEVCNEGETECASLEPDLTRIMATSRDYQELYRAWDGWRDAVGAPARNDYSRYVELKNEAAKANDQSDAGAYWRSWYEMDDLQEQADKLYNQLRPLYENLHAYVRRKLYDIYGPEFINLRGPIPAHLLGNMWAQSWSNLLDLLEPYPNKPTVDITSTLVEKGYNAEKMFQESDDFFKDLGLIEMPTEFWAHSMIEKPKDGRDVVCHASAWDFYNQVDFRIKQCTDITMDDFITIHHEMGHVEYFLQYEDQPVMYRDGANPGFHEAVGDVLALSVSTPKHLVSVGLLESADDDEEADLNFLMSMALDKIAFLPFGYLMDQWRWSVFNGTTPPAKYNTDWWKLRTRYQGIIPPDERSEDDFDPGAKYHIPADVPYIRYFISFIIQFQFHEALCAAAGQTGPLYKCDIDGSQEAGKLLGDMLKLGSSQPWPVAMTAITGTEEMTAEPILKYFEPLIAYLEGKNYENGDIIGWMDEEFADWRPADPSTWSGASSLGTQSMVTLLSVTICALLVRKTM